MNSHGQRLLLLGLNGCYLLLCAANFGFQGNHEFLIYVGVVAMALGVITVTDRMLRYPLDVLWGLTLWGMLHMAGGGVYVGGIKLYEWMMVPISENIFRFDQFVHMFGFGVSTLLMAHVLRTVVQPAAWRFKRVAMLMLLAGLGVGALNEVVEFIVVLVLPETGVGGYLNTSLDLVANLLGALLAVLYLRLKNPAYCQTAGPDQ